MHTDSSMGEAPPNYVSLFCLRPARAGGMSIVSSAAAAHNYFLAEHPALLRRLYEAFYRDHQEYQAADAAATNFRPVFAWESGLRTRFNARHIVRGYEKTGRGARRGRRAGGAPHGRVPRAIRPIASISGSSAARSRC